MQPGEQRAAREFFELCRVPWEFFRPERRYEVVVCTSSIPDDNHNLKVVFSSTAPGNDTTTASTSEGQDRLISHAGRSFPIYGKLVTFPGGDSALVTETSTGKPVIQTGRQNEVRVIQVGYNLFDEVGTLLSTGQPARHAAAPTLELHIRLLRDLILRAGIPVVEIPPVPAGHAFVACLTHDVDHPVLKNHLGDHTMLGFLFRATIGSLVKTCQGRLSLRKLAKNWAAALRLPFVHLGLAEDFWRDFNRFQEIESGAPSTFFVIPERNNPGRTRTGSAPAQRASSYEIDELSPVLRKIVQGGGEVAVHGLDSWLDEPAGRRERQRLSGVPGANDAGIRMHWLYFDQASPLALERAGFAYDSTVGYNETIGYRAGTTQVYRPLDTVSLLELPLHIMDTALFYPDYLNLGEKEAHRRIAPMLDDAASLGGVVTLNWHDRSIAPERLWGDFYREVVDDVRRRGAWFATAAQTVAWFRLRRSATIEAVREGSQGLRVRAQLTELDSDLPHLRIRVHKPHLPPTHGKLATGPDLGIVDIPFTANVDTLISL